MNQSVIKSVNFWMLIFSVFALFSTFFCEYCLHLSPCPLCLMQRLCIEILAFMCLGFFVAQKWSKLIWYRLLFLLVIALGVILAARQMWLQLFSSHDGGACLPGFEALVSYFSWDVILKMLFWGSNDCATVAWRFLGLPLSAWSMLYFLVIFVLFMLDIFYKESLQKS
ncbi:MAG: disulfide bond formation protein B [Gammaproteobacteria bacterium]|nr:disulfide bond formation protein B [Gammaproteobacteria bacterium]